MVEPMIQATTDGDTMTFFAESDVEIGTLHEPDDGTHVHWEFSYTRRSDIFNLSSSGGRT